MFDKYIKFYMNVTEKNCIFQTNFQIVGLLMVSKSGKITKFKLSISTIMTAKP